MLANFKTFTSFSAPRLDLIEEFYNGKLGLEVSKDVMGVLMFKTGGDTKFMVYEKPTHTAAEYTVLNFEVDDIEKAVSELNKKGIMMEQYPEMGTDENGIAGAGNGDSKMAWFKDPAGNIVSLFMM